MNVSAGSIRRPIPAVLLFLILTVTGLLGFQSLSVEEFPDIDLPEVVVSVSWPGATPSQMEAEITRKIEDPLASLGLVEHIFSTVTEGLSQTTVSFSIEKNMQEATDEVFNAVAGVRSSLPADVPDPHIARITASDISILTYAVESARMDELDLSWFVDDTVSKSLRSVPGLDSLRRQGGVEREVQVELDPMRL
jgi:multidrug efflux pump subunit AcrB